MAITTKDGLIAASKSKIRFRKQSRTADAAAVFCSLWTIGDDPIAGATPPTGSGEAPTSATQGAMKITEVGGGADIVVGRALISMATLGSVILYDRLVHTSGLSGTVTTAQTVNTAALTRYTSGVGVEIFIEHYTATGASAATLTVNYTNQDDAAKTTSIAFYASPLAGLMQLVPLAAGDTGAKSVQSVQLSATTGTAGDFGITLIKTITELAPDTAGAGKVFGPFAVGIPAIQPSACLATMVLTSTTSTGIITGIYDILQG